MKINLVSSKEMWNAAAVKFSADTFHQSWAWGETHKKNGGLIWRVGLFDEGDELIGIALTIKVVARRGSFLLVPHGPLFDESITQNQRTLSSALDEITKYLVVLAKSEKCFFVRLAPTLERTDENERVFSALGYRRAPIFVQSELSWRLNLHPSIDELLAGMRKSTRYILKREEGYGLEYESTDGLGGFERFYDLYKETVKNQEFVGHSKNFMMAEFESFAQDGSARFYFSSSMENGGRVDLAAAMIITQGSSGFYHYGASRKDDKNTPAPHLLQWHIIKDLKNRGFSYYNFWGISDDDKPNHPWKGLTIFKKGFGGEPRAYVKTQDYILSPFYWVNWVIETLRRIKRHY